jgi:ABC-type phosphate/phosphonate transport system substrate-binding protein
MHSLEDLQREMDGMSGEGFLFAIFPVETVRVNMAAGGVKASASEVERLWTAYQKATMAEGLAPYSKAGGGAVAAPLLQSMEKETGYPRMTVAAFLNGLEKAVREQGWDWKWLDPAAAREAGQPLSAGESISKAIKSTGQTAADFLRPTLDPVTNLVKYAAVGLVAGAVIYGLYHGSKLWKSKRRKG